MIGIRICNPDSWSRNFFFAKTDARYDKRFGKIKNRFYL